MKIKKLAYLLGKLLMKFSSTGLPAPCITIMYFISIMKDCQLSGKYNRQVGNQTAKDFLCFFSFHFPMKAAKVMFVVARRIPRPPALNDCPPIAACSSDNS